MATDAEMAVIRAAIAYVEADKDFALEEARLIAAVAALRSDDPAWIYDERKDERP